jgi:hypothetical protein
MTYILAFHPNDVISRPNKQAVSLADFRAANPLVPLVDEQWFQLDEGRILIINKEGGGNEPEPSDMHLYAALIDSIKNPPAPAVDKFYSVDVHPHAYLELDGVQGSVPDDVGVPTGFTIDAEGVQQWQYRDKTAEELVTDANNAAKAEIAVLEGAITLRRLREATLGTDNGWLDTQDALITVERNKINE